MKIAKIEIIDKKLFIKIKDSLTNENYIECDLCGAYRAEAKDVARGIHSLLCINEDDPDNYLKDCLSNILGQIIISAPHEFDSFGNYQKWLEANESMAYHFIPDEYGDPMHGKYDELIIFSDLKCDCFSKDKIKERVDI